MNAAQDAAGNASGAAGASVSVDRTAPSVVSMVRTTPAAATTNAGSLTFTVSFSEPVTGVDPSDFGITAGLFSTGAIQVTGGPVSYSVTIPNVVGDGTVALKLVNGDTIRDAAGNQVVVPFSGASFSTPATFAQGPNAGEAKLGDFDADGKLDLAIAHPSNGSNAFLTLSRGNGNGTFQAQTTIATAFGAYRLEVGDLNGDGKLDVALLISRSTGRVGVLLGNGDGTFQTMKTFSVGTYPAALTLGDVNGDGKVDVVVANEYSSISVLRGNAAYDGAFDWNLDGFVDGVDLNKLYQNFGTIWKL